MKTLGKVLAGIGLAKGIALLAAPHDFLKVWTQDSMPPWLREQAKPWLKLSEETLRPVGAGLMLLSVVMLCLAEERRGK